MSIGFLVLSKERVPHHEEGNQMLSYIEFCDQKQFKGTQTWIQTQDFGDFKSALFRLEDQEHNCPDLHVILLNPVDIRDLGETGKEIKKVTGCDVASIQATQGGYTMRFVGGAGMVDAAIAKLRRDEMKAV